LAASLAAPVFLIAPASASVLFSCSSVTGSATFSPGLTHDKRPQSLSTGPTAPAGPADIALVSTSDTGVKGNGNSYGSLSADGTQVVLEGQATNLDLGDTDTFSDVYVKDLTTGDITLASTSDAGVKGNRDSQSGSPSADGTKVAFSSQATNLDPADTDTIYDAYVKDLSTGNITLVSTSDTGVKGNGHTSSPSLSDDGTKVAFISEATNLDPADTDTFDDVYVKDLSTGNITLASTSDTGVKGNGHSLGSLSADGTKATLISQATNLDPGDTDSVDDVYVKDLTTGDIVLASTSDAGVKGNANSFGPLLSADGTQLSFFSAATNLDPTDTDSSWDVYVKDLSTGDVVLASTSDAGVKGNGNSFDPALSADGTKVAITSQATNLDPADTTGQNDVYVKDLSTGDITLASTSDTGVKGNGDSYGALSTDGTQVILNTQATNLDPADTDTLDDVYVKDLPSIPTSIDISGCSNGQSGTTAIIDARSFASRPLGCPVSLGGALGNDYADQTPVLLGSNPSLRIDWASGPDSFGVAKIKMGTTGTEWRVVLSIQASGGHSTPATNQYLPASGSGFTKTKLKGRLDWSALDSFNCTSGTADPISWLDLVNNGGFIVKNA
jgi:hypothetical protein